MICVVYYNIRSTLSLFGVWHIFYIRLNVYSHYTNGGSTTSDSMSIDKFGRSSLLQTQCDNEKLISLKDCQLIENCTVKIDTGGANIIKVRKVSSLVHAAVLIAISFFKWGKTKA